MSARYDKILISTKGFDDFVDITLKIKNVVSSFGIQNGILNLYLTSPCASLKIIEREPGLDMDLSKLMETILPINKVYQHDNVWYDGNASAHLKSIILGNSLNLPIIDSNIYLGLNQQIILLDFDNKPSQKEIIVSVVG